MIPLKAALYEYLRDRAAIAAVVGLEDGSSKIYPNAAPKDVARPFIVYRRTGYSNEPHMLAASDLSTALMRIEVQGSTGIQTGTLSEAVRDALNGMNGRTIGTTAPVMIRAVFLREQDDDFIKPTEQEPIEAHRTYMDFEIWYVESVPSL